jgi:hypothetical protein
MGGRPEREGRVVPGRADVWLGDLVVAIEEVVPRDEDELWRIARLLGLGRPLRTERQSAPSEPGGQAAVPLDPLGAVGQGTLPVTAPRSADECRPALPPGGSAGGTAMSAAPDGGEGADDGEVTSAEWSTTPDGPGSADGAPPSGHGHRPSHHALPPVAYAPAGRQAWVRDPLPRPDRNLMSVRPPYTPLLARSSAAALLEAALSGRAPDGEVEIEDAVDLLARGVPLAVLPRRMRRTLRHGVQILVDHGPAMELFARDQAHVCARVEALVGKDRTDLLRFAYSPLRGAGAGPLWTWDTYRPPPRDSAVLLLSDCGTIGPRGDQGRSTPAEWQRFAELVRRNGARPLALLPVPERRVPEWLATVMPVLCWDRGTTVGRVASRMNAWREGRTPRCPPAVGGGEPR